MNAAQANLQSQKGEAEASGSGKYPGMIQGNQVTGRGWWVYIRHVRWLDVAPFSRGGEAWYRSEKHSAFCGVRMGIRSCGIRECKRPWSDNMKEGIPVTPFFLAAVRTAC
jgi:hypothetical protein